MFAGVVRPIDVLWVLSAVVGCTQRFHAAKQVKTFCVGASEWSVLRLSLWFLVDFRLSDLRRKRLRLYSANLRNLQHEIKQSANPPGRAERERATRQPAGWMIRS